MIIKVVGDRRPENWISGGGEGGVVYMEKSG